MGSVCSNHERENMILKAMCDRCKVIGTTDEVQYDPIMGIDLCQNCAKTERLNELLQRRDKLQKWLEETHLKHLRELNAEIERTESDTITRLDGKQP